MISIPRSVHGAIVTVALATATLASTPHRTAPEPTLRLVSPVCGEEVWLTVQASPDLGEGGPRLDLPASAGLVRQGKEIQVQTPVDIRLDASEAFRLTFSSGSSQQLLHLVLTPTPERQVVVEGSEFVLSRERRGGPVELEAVGAVEMRTAEHVRDAPECAVGAIFVRREAVS